MSQFFQTFGVGDLALGKPPLYCLLSGASVKEAIDALRELGLMEISVWEAEGSSSSSSSSKCIGSINTLGVVCFLASCLYDQSMSVEEALKQPVSALSSDCSRIQHVDLDARLTKVLELAASGVQYMVVPISASSRLPVLNSSTSRWQRKDYCCVTQEAVTRYMMGCISAFCPLSLFSIDELDIINTNFMFLTRDAKSTSGLDLFRKASEEMTAVAVVDYDDMDEEDQSHKGENKARLKLVGDISSSTLRHCDEHLAAAALAGLTAGDFLYCIQQGSRGPEHFRKSMRDRMLNNVAEGNDLLSRSLQEAASVDEDNKSDSEGYTSGSSSGSWCWNKNRGSTSRSWSSCLTCKPWSSLVAVMAQSLAHRSSYIWVTDAENMLVGIVTYSAILGVLVKELHSDRGQTGANQKLFSTRAKLTRYTN